MAPGEGDRPPTYLLDTNTLLAYIRGNALGQHVESVYHLRDSPYKPLLCIVSVGEALALARDLGWGEAKTAKLRKLLGDMVWVDISSPEVLDAYADVYQASKPKGRTLGQNDLWIAATAKAAQAVLLTTDRDFDHLADRHIKVHWIDPDRAGV